MICIKSWDNGDEYANIFGGYDHFYQIKQSLLVGHVSMINILLRRDKTFLLKLSQHDYVFFI